MDEVERRSCDETRVSRVLATELISKWCWGHGMAVNIEERGTGTFFLAGLNVKIRVCAGKLVAESERHFPDYDLSRLDYVQANIENMARELGIHAR